MDVNCFHNISKEIKFYLVFFCLILIVGCGRGDLVHIEQVDYENKRAVGVTFTTELDVEEIRVFVGEESQTSVIGVIVSQEDRHKFSPVIPFTSGQTYTLRKKNTEVLASFTIPHRVRTQAAELLAIYPKVDTVPENLLKMYFEFAQPMQEVGNALDFITVINETDSVDTQPFLRLESELWNKERTLLTLWLDPGRIKTDLIPNRERGLPLTAGKSYTVTINSSWKSIEGASLKKKYLKKFYVGPRDDRRPNANDWQVRMQDEDSLKSLYLNFKEPMDAFLAIETIRMYGTNNKQIKGEFKLLKNESVLRFVPEEEWKSSEIEIRIESRLEDLAGNNLNRLFDTPLDGNRKLRDTVKIKSLRFKLR